MEVTYTFLSIDPITQDNNPPPGIWRIALGDVNDIFDKTENLMNAAVVDAADSILLEMLVQYIIGRGVCYMNTHTT